MEKKIKSLNVAKMIKGIIVYALIGFIVYAGYQAYIKVVREKEVLKQIIERLQADTRIAEVIVVKQGLDPATGRQKTTIKFLEFDSAGDPLEPKYFSFLDHNIIQFQSLVVRFQDRWVAAGDPFKGKSVYLFWKVFVLDGAKTQEYVITPIDTVPQGYKVSGPRNKLEDELWKGFWEYALDPKKAAAKGVKNAQVEAPGTKFIPGILYTLKIEHNGGMRIDAALIPKVLRGERIP